MNKPRNLGVRFLCPSPWTTWHSWFGVRDVSFDVSEKIIVNLENNFESVLENFTSDRLGIPLICELRHDIEDLNDKITRT